MNRYTVACMSDISFTDPDFELSITLKCSLARIEKTGESGFEGVEEFTVVKVLAHTHEDTRVIAEGHTIPEFKTNPLEFESDEAAILWFKLNKGGT